MGAGRLAFPEMENLAGKAGVFGVKNFILDSMNLRFLGSNQRLGAQVKRDVFGSIF